MRPRCRLQRNCASIPVISISASDSVFMIPEQPLRQRLRLIRMRLRNPFHPCDRLVDTWVVLHQRATTQRIHPEVDRIVPRREPRKVCRIISISLNSGITPKSVRINTAPPEQGSGVYRRHIQPASLYAFLPADDFSKIKSSFWLTCVVAALDEPYKLLICHC